MINGNETIEEYTLHNKIYIPTEYYKQNYKYTLSGDEITIITDNNCRTQYSSTYCDCYRYNEKYNIITEAFECNRNTTNYIINNQYITDNINNSLRITTDYTNYYTIAGIAILITIGITSLFKKNSRRL